MLYRLFRLPPLVYFIAAPLVLALAVFLYFDENGKAADRAAALSHEPPAEVALTDITSDDSGNDYNEVVVRAQGDVMNTIEMVRTKRGSERGRKVFMPLYAPDAADFSGPAIAVLQVDKELTEEHLASLYVSDGPAGPVFLLDGTLEGGPNSEAVEALGDARLAPGFRTIKPFIDGREAALSDEGIGTGLLIFGLLLALALGLYGFFRKRHLDAAKAAEDEAYGEYAAG